MHDNAVQVTGCGASVVRDGQPLVNVYRGADGHFEAFAAAGAYIPLLWDLLESFDRLPMAECDPRVVEELVAELVANEVRWDMVEPFDDEGDSEQVPLGEVGACDEEPVDLHDPKALGRLGEELAVRYLCGRGWTVAARNYRTRYGEADIVCLDDDETVLVEVKTRLGATPVPEESVDRKKMERYRKMMLHFAAEAGEKGVRFDVIGVNVIGDHKAHVHHYQDVCGWGE